jgi:hypothetical protein
MVQLGGASSGVVFDPLTLEPLFNNAAGLRTLDILQVGQAIATGAITFRDRSTRAHCQHAFRQPGQCASHLWWAAWSGFTRQMIVATPSGPAPQRL